MVDRCAQRASSHESAEAIVECGDADFVLFGRHFTSNPDLPERWRLGLPLTPHGRSTFWGGTEKDYKDFPKIDARLKADA